MYNPTGVCPLKLTGVKEVAQNVNPFVACFDLLFTLMRMDLSIITWIRLSISKNCRGCDDANNCS